MLKCLDLVGNPWMLGPVFFVFGCLNDPRPCKQNEATQGG